MNPVCVAQVTLTMGQGGIENLILSLSRVIRPESAVFKLYCLDAGGELLAETEKSGIPTRIFCRKPGLDWRLILSLANAFKQDGINVVHTHNQAAHFYGSLGAWLAGVPVVINTEHSRHYIQDHWRRRLEKLILSKITNTMVTVSSELRQLSIDNDGIESEKLAVVVNGVDIRRFDDVNPETVAEFRLKYGIPSTAKVLSIVARLHPIKNHKLLLQAVKIMTTDFPDIRLLIVGDGEERNNLEKLVCDLNLSRNVNFLGNRSDVQIILKASNATVLCSVTEGLPLVLLESMAAHTPIVLTQGANRSGLIQDGYNGVVSGDQPQDLSKAISLCLTSNSKCNDMTTTAYNQVVANYSIDKTASDYVCLYTQRMCGK